MKIDPNDPYGELRARPELALIAVLENTLARMVDLLLARNPELCVYPRAVPGSQALQADRVIGRTWDLLEALRRYRSGSAIETASSQDAQAE
jgi:hypothetical protein